MIHMTTNEEQNRETYTKGSPFVRLLGTPGRVKILDVFLRKHYQELTPSEVARLADIAPSTFHRNIDYLVEAGIVDQTREIGGATLYQLNKENPVSEIFGKARSSLLDHLQNIPDTGEFEQINAEDMKIRIPEQSGGRDNPEWATSESVRHESRRKLGLPGD